MATFKETAAVTSDPEDQFLGSLVDSFVSRFRIEDRTHLTPKSKRIRHRDPKTVYALVLHQMAFSRGSENHKYDRVTAHYAILPDGKILQLHPVSAYLYASNGFNRGSVAVEFAGNFPNTRGSCWKKEKYGCHTLTQAQIDAGRYLVRHLISSIGLTHILAHRQSSGSRENDPGPDIWYHVGQWGVDKYGLKDGGPGFKIGSGKPIPSAWRTWGSGKPSPEYDFPATAGAGGEDELRRYAGRFRRGGSRSLVSTSRRSGRRRSGFRPGRRRLRRPPVIVRRRILPLPLPERGSEYVRWVQSSLNLVLNLRLAVNGLMGPDTRSALRTFQRRQGLVVDGIAGPETRKALVQARQETRQDAPAGSEEEFAFLEPLRRIASSVTHAAREMLLVQQAIDRGTRDPNQLTNLVFFARHPERRGRSLQRSEPDFQRLAAEWTQIRNRIVLPALRAPATPSNPTGATPALSGPREPAGYRVVSRIVNGRSVKRGLARYGNARLDQTLRRLRGSHNLQVSDDEIDLFQRIANVETSGQIQGLNTWDSAVVSIGFMQLTLQHGKLQEWIQRAPAAFRRYGIELDPGRTYSWRGGQQAAIRGAATKEELRWDGWAQRFYLAGLDPEIIVAEVALAREWMQRHLKRFRRHLERRGQSADFPVFMNHYRRSAAVRGLFQEAYNNLPLAAINGTLAALQAARRAGGVNSARFLALLQDGIGQAYRARNDNGENVITKTQQGAQ